MELLKLIQMLMEETRQDELQSQINTLYEADRIDLRITIGIIILLFITLAYSIFVYLYHEKKLNRLEKVIKQFVTN